MRSLRMVPVAPFYLGATPVTATTYSKHAQSQSQSQASFDRAPTSPPPPSSSNQKPSRSPTRASMPPPGRHTPPTPPSNNSTFLNQPQSPEGAERPRNPEPIPEDVQHGRDDDGEEVRMDLERPGGTDTATKRKSIGVINPEFKFPSPASSPHIPDGSSPSELQGKAESPPPKLEGGIRGVEHVPVTPSSIEVPPPPPVEKEISRARGNSVVDDSEDDVGPTVEVDLS